MFPENSTCKKVIKGVFLVHVLQPLSHAGATIRQLDAPAASTMFCFSCKYAMAQLRYVTMSNQCFPSGWSRERSDHVITC